MYFVCMLLDVVPELLVVARRQRTVNHYLSLLSIAYSLIAIDIWVRLCCCKRFVGYLIRVMLVVTVSLVLFHKNSLFSLFFMFLFTHHCSL